MGRWIALALLVAGCATTTSTSKPGSTMQQPQTYTAPYEEVFQAAAKATALLSWELTHSDQAAGILQARTPASLWTNGDAVSIQVAQTDAGVRVEVSSMSRQAIDWGKGGRNLEAFYKKMRLLLGQ